MPPSVKALTPKKERRARSWANGQERKKARVRAQAEAEARNRVLRGRGELTPWEQAKSAARFRKGVGSKTLTPPARGEGESNISSKDGKREAIRAAKRGASAHVPSTD